MTLKTVIKWAVYVGDQGRITQLPGISQHAATSIPEEGKTIIHPYLVDPQTLQPCPVIVSRVTQTNAQCVVVVVARPQ